RGHSSRRGHTTRIDEREYRARTVWHSATIWNRQPRNVLVHAGRVHAKRLEYVVFNVIGPPRSADSFDDQSGKGKSKVGVLPPHRWSKRRLPVGIQALDLIGSWKRVRRPVVP